MPALTQEDINNLIGLSKQEEKEVPGMTIMNGLSQNELDAILRNFAGTKKDKLTGMLNAEQFKEDINRFLKDAESGLFDVTLVITDIDEFKKVNDNFGHQVGDDVIKKTAEVLGSMNCPHQVYRYSGDSFAVICPKVEKETVFLMMEEVRKTFAGDELCQKVEVTMCAGIATYPEDGANETEILRKADGALYRAKISGRNKIALAKEEKLVTKTAHYTVEQLKRLKDLSEETKIVESALMREALDELFKKYDQMKKADKPTILIIDDAAFMRMMVKDIVEKNGYEVVAEAADGIEGLEKFEKYNPDFTFLDITMPNMDGLTFLREVKKKEKNKIIMLSAMSSQSIFIDAVRKGADAFICKPFKAERLTQVLNNIEKYQIKSEYADTIEEIIPKEYNPDRPLPQAEIDKLIAYGQNQKK